MNNASEVVSKIGRVTLLVHGKILPSPLVLHPVKVNINYHGALFIDKIFVELSVNALYLIIMGIGG